MHLPPMRENFQDFIIVLYGKANSSKDIETEQDRLRILQGL